MVNSFAERHIKTGEFIDSHTKLDIRLQDSDRMIIIPVSGANSLQNDRGLSFQEFRTRADLNIVGKGESWMATYTKADIRKLRKKKARLKKKLRCRFCPDGCDNSPRPVYVDYKDLRTLRAMVNRQGQILARRRTGSCAKYQRAVRRAVLRARFMGLMPYVPEE